MESSPRRVVLLIGSLVLPFVAQRIFLHYSPDTDLNIGRYNVHHLFTGILLIVIGGIPLALFRGQQRWLDLAAIVFGIGLSLALDEWVYLITTDGTNASYLLPISLWGGVVMVAAACCYAFILYFCGKHCQNKSGQDQSHRTT